MTGVLLKGMGGLYTVLCDDGSRQVLRARGKIRRTELSPVPGDRVRITPGSGEEHGWLEEILPRTSYCLRPAVANLECLVLVVAPAPAPDLLLVDRLMARARQEGIRTVLCVNKRDMDPSLGDALAKEYAGAETPVVMTCALDGQNLQALRAQMEGSLSCLAGQSGVGKSALLGQLLGISLKTGDMSRKIERGRHTTRHAELLEGNGLRVFDTPGFSLLSLAGMEPEMLQALYPEMEGLSGRCRFQPCLHDREPGCAVAEAAEQGNLPMPRLLRYRALLAEITLAWRGRYD